MMCCVFFFFSSRRRHTRFKCDWSSDVCSSDLTADPLSASEDVDGSRQRVAGAVLEADVVVDPVADRLHARPARLGRPEQLPGGAHELVGKAVAARQGVVEELARNLFHPRLADAGTVWIGLIRGQADSVVAKRQGALRGEDPLHGVAIDVGVLVHGKRRRAGPGLGDQLLPSIRARANLNCHGALPAHVVVELAANPQLDRLSLSRNAADTIAVPSTESLGANYQTNGFYDEMLAGGGRPRPVYRRLYERLNRPGPAELPRRHELAMQMFRNHGITFAVYPDAQGNEKVFPFDIIPRGISARA